MSPRSSGLRLRVIASVSEAIQKLRNWTASSLTLLAVTIPFAYRTANPPPLRRREKGAEIAGRVRPADTAGSTVTGELAEGVTHLRIERWNGQLRFASPLYELNTDLGK